MAIAYNNMRQVEEAVTYFKQLSKVDPYRYPADPNITTEINHWPRLPEEIVLFILSHLPQKDLVNVSEVSKPFRDMSRDASLWTKHLVSLGIFLSPFSTKFFLFDIHPKNVSRGHIYLPEF